MMERLTMWFRCIRCETDVEWNSDYSHKSEGPGAFPAARRWVRDRGWVRKRDGWCCPSCAK